MGDLIEGTWQTPKQRAYMRELEAEIASLTRVVEALREAHVCANRSRRSGEIIAFSRTRRTDNA